MKNINTLLLTCSLVLFFAACVSTSNIENNGLDTDTDTDTENESSTDADSDTDSDSDSDTDSDSDSDTDSDGDTDDEAPPDAGPVEPSPPLDPAEPCAEDRNADRNADSDINQTTGTVVPDLGIVPVGGEFTGDTALDGEYDVFQQTVSIPIESGILHAAGLTIKLNASNLSGTVFAPSTDGGTSIAPGKWPLVLVLAGFQGSYTMYRTYSLHYASHGFTVLGVDTHSNLTTASHDKESYELVQCLDWIDTEDSPLHGFIDMTKIAVSGHSKGGKLTFFLAAIDPRIDFVIAWDPSNAGGPPCPIPGCNSQPVAPNCDGKSPGIEHYMHAESIVLGMPRSAVTPDRHHNSIHFYRGAPSPAHLVFFDASHVAPVSNQNVVVINKRVQMALLLDRFKGMEVNREYLPDTTEGKAAIESESLIIRVESK